jgi:hypothetical protein
VRTGRSFSKFREKFWKFSAFYMKYIGTNFSLGSVEGEVSEIWETISPISPDKPFPALG